MKDQSGAVSLLVVVILLSTISVLSLSSVRTLIQDIHISHTRIERDTHRWLLRGISNCVTTLIAEKPFAEVFNVCRGNNTVTVDVSKGLVRDVLIESGEVEFSVELPTANRSGVIKSSMDLIFPNVLSINPDPGTKTASAEWQCRSLRYSGSLYFQQLSTYPLSMAPFSPVWGFLPSMESCASEHYTVGATSVSSFKSDYLADAGYKPFTDLWDVNESDWFLLMKNDEVGHAPSTLELLGSHRLIATKAEDLPVPAANVNCANGIVEQIQRSRRIIWVYGGCGLDEQGVSTINNAVQTYFSHGGVILVFHNGPLYINASTALNALVMVFQSQLATDLTSQWQSLGLESQVNDDISLLPFPSLQASQTLASLAFVQKGTTYPKGGLILAGKGYQALIQSSYFAYQKDLIVEALAMVRPVEVVEGSWYEE
ncbi:hypothetical protein [Vibrio viridaestus]|uniref:Uncharacterized protein n=1 Tax=Vibrio viridaestus TaxID=2487322 RepID=A0A3N9TDW3_9VIBR|nr:hypothetical protein [Vibrio viridaestus]RQW62407.1 hypothetical protein EES38_14625 [Vibrio viridaestus]